MWGQTSSTSVKAGVLLAWLAVICSCIVTQCHADISSGLREAIVTAHKSGKGYRVISKQSGVHRSTEQISTMGQHSRGQAIFPEMDVPANSPKGQIVKCTKKLH